MRFDFYLEKKLKQENPELSSRYTECMNSFDILLQRFLVSFPRFTDHSLLHSLNVLNYSNQFLGLESDKLSIDEIYIYLMAVMLHDVGMAVPESSLQEYLELSGRADYLKTHAEEEPFRVARKFHNDFSAIFIEKYYQFFDIPDPSYAKAIGLVARGHRKVDLFDRDLYPLIFTLENGSEIHLPALAAIIRVADEMDLANDRNPCFLYRITEVAGATERDYFEFGKHNAISGIELTEDRILIHARTDQEQIRRGILEASEELNSKLQLCLSVLNVCSDLRPQFNHTETVFNE